MTLSDFIEKNMESLLEEWETFAREAQPEHADLDREELRDWANGLLSAMAEEMRLQADDRPGGRPPRGKQQDDVPTVTEAARVHAMDRLAQGFRIDQMISEYRELRGTVVRRWASETDGDGDAATQLVYFNKVLDQALTESIRGYTDMLERARDLFIGALGHDMRTPIGSILVTAEALLLSSDDLNGSQLQGAVRIRNAAKRINRMLQDLLDFTQTRLGGQLPMSREQTNLAETCTAIVDEVRALHPDRVIQLECPAALTGYFDAGRVGQMLANLALNAVKHGDEAPVRVTARETDEDIYIRVHNEGAPIPRELQETMFEPLVRGRSREQNADRHPQGGLGLGLFIAGEIAQGHDGYISVDSTASGGTTFEARLRRTSGSPERTKTDWCPGQDSNLWPSD